MNIEGTAEVSAEEQKPLTRVVVTDVDISFFSMVGLLVKLTFAAIPAAIIVAFVVMLAVQVAGNLLR